MTDTSPVPTESVRMIGALTGLRAVAAAVVVIEHLRPVLAALLPVTRPLNSTLAGGNLGVEVFFVLSGFILAHNYHSRFGEMRVGALGGYLRARLARIYPVQVTVTVGLGLLFLLTTLTGIGGLRPATPFTVTGLISNLTLTQAFPWGQLWNLPAWSISCEAVAYVAFPVLVLLAVRLGRMTTVVTAGALLVATPVLVGAVAGTDFAPTHLSVIWIRIGLEFPAGVLLWAAWRTWHSPRPRWLWDTTAIITACVIIGVLAVLRTDTSALFWVTPLIGLLVVACAGSTGIVRRILEARPMQWGGRISYSVYMTHTVVLTVIGRWQLLSASGLALRLVALLGYVTVVVAVGAGMYYLVEEPGRRLLNRRGRTPRSA